MATGKGPYCGQAVHFKFFAPEPKAYAVNRYTFEAERHWGIVNEHLADKQWMLGDTYTLVDMAVWGWARLIPRVMGEAGLAAMPNVKRSGAATRRSAFAWRAIRCRGIRFRPMIAALEGSWCKTRRK